MDERRFSLREVPGAPKKSERMSKAPEFSYLKFAELPWQKGVTEGGVPVYRAETTVTIQGRRLFLQASNRIYEQANGSLASLLFSLRVSPDSPKDVHLFLNISNKKSDPRLKASINIGRSEGTEHMPPRMGIATYEKGLDFLSMIATDKPLLHRVTAAPDDDDFKKWEARFVPLLERRGYQKMEAGAWEKTYPARAA